VHGHPIDSRRLNGKHKSHKAAHTHQQRLLPPAESAVVRQCIYLANAGFPARIRTIRVIATKILEERARKLPPYQPLPPLGKAWITAFLTRQNELRVATLDHLIKNVQLLVTTLPQLRPSSTTIKEAI